MAELGSLLADAEAAKGGAGSAARGASSSQPRLAAVLASLPDAWLGRMVGAAGDELAFAVPAAGGPADGRCVSLALPPAWPAAPPVVSGDTPPLPWAPTGPGLGETLDAVSSAFAAAAPVALLLADLDARARVLDPPLPAPAAVTWRRLALTGGRASVELGFDPASPASPPTLAFLGPPAASSGPAAHAAATRWDPGLGGVAAVEAWLGAALDRAADAGATDASASTSDADCAVCYAYRLDGAPPTVACANPRCGRPFHAACLRGWLQGGGGGGGGGGGDAHGACPYCGEGVTVPGGG
jgi:E3 ubiquitin-protein ligase FANCL